MGVYALGKGSGHPVFLFSSGHFFLLSTICWLSLILDLTQQGHLVDLVQGEVKALLQSALDVALSVVRANPTVLEGLGAHLEGTTLLLPYFFKLCFSASISYYNSFKYLYRTI